MDKKHRNKLMFWWSLGTAAAIALFWTIYWYITKEVPVITEIKIPFILTWELPFTVSRWWDILLGSIYSVIIIQILRNFEIEELLAIIIRGILLVILPVVVCFLYWSFVILIYIFGDGILSFLGIIKKHGLDDINLFSPTILIISLFCSFLFILSLVFKANDEGEIGEVFDFFAGCSRGLLLDLWLVCGVVYGLVGGLVVELFFGIRAIVQLIKSFIHWLSYKKWTARSKKIWKKSIQNTA